MWVALRTTLGDLRAGQFEKQFLDLPEVAWFSDDDPLTTVRIAIQ